MTSVVHQSGEGNLAKLHRLSRNPFPRVASLQCTNETFINSEYISNSPQQKKSLDSQTGNADFHLVLPQAGYHHACNR